ncbi:MAG TPA: serine hydrolase, partial [Candidatus Dormibacteraeota bacterium]|nr:serine hydrolase [Candidatus Dormibacteraeota bacterium]
MFTSKYPAMRVTVCAAIMLALCISIPLAWHPANALAAALQGPASKPAQKARVKTAPPTVNAVANPAPSATAELTAADLEAFLGGLMPVEIQRADIAGAVVAVVKDGKLLFAKGYGYADVAKKTPISPETTLFRPGSISKTFTW